MPGKYNVRLEPPGKNLKASAGTPVADLLLEFGIEFPCGGKGTCLNCKVRILKGDMGIQEEYRTLLTQKGFDMEWRLACKSFINQDVTLEVFPSCELILADNTSFPFTPAYGFGIAIDLGTTSLVLQLIDLSTGQVIDAITEVNKQYRYGADILSRVGYALDPAGLSKLSQTVREQLWKIIRSIMAKHDRVPRKIILVGNTVMHHLFSGMEVDSLAHFPFTSEGGGKKSFTASELGWSLPDQTQISFMPAIGGFVGSDVLAGLLATEMDTSDDLTVFIDLGTNGEVAVGNRNQILVASTAAGPAFEGMQISQGMRAVTGAVSSVFQDGDKPGFHVIGNITPRGICGSGLMDAVAVLKAMDRISESGRFIPHCAEIEIAPSVKLTQKDIYEFVLAKAAVSSGIHILLTLLKKSHKDVKKVFIAGSFGHFITVRHAIEVGLLEFPEEKIVKAGNTALIGAKMLLFLNDREANRILDITRHITLESQPAFQDIFIQKMIIKKSDLG
jgi:uncharacterized 2Fe-2S/4Fe-4S cluster protein (DUF4445 family)